jgi:DNA-binding IclR family transcriptional regulator
VCSSDLYRLSMKMLGLGNLALRGIQVRDIALPVLRRLVEETGITGHLAVLDGSEAVYITRVPPAGMIQIDTWVGRRIPLYSSGSGKALLAWLPQVQANVLLESIELQRSTRKTIVLLPKLRQELKKIREVGFSIDDEENTPGVRCVAAPILAPPGEAGVVLSLTGAMHQLADDRLMKIAEKVKDAAHEISIAMGGPRQAAPRRNA